MGTGLGAWGKRQFQFSLLATGQFVVVTVEAMFFYPGGTPADPTTQDYSFWSSFFSDLGRLAAHNGAANTFSAILFFVALTLAGLGLAVFFLAIPQFFRQSYGTLQWRKGEKNNAN